MHYETRSRDRVKILYWDRDGFAVWSKRLEEGTYAVPVGQGAGERRRDITTPELGALLSGIGPQASEAAQTLSALQLTKQSYMIVLLEIIK